MLQGFCFVSMYKPSFTLNIKIQRLVLLIYYCQTLTLAFPLDGWNLWTYKDGAFRMTKNLLNMFLIFPYVNEVKSSTLIYVLILLFSLFNIFMLLAIFLIAKFKNKLSFMLTFTYWYLVIVPKLFFMPQLFIFIGSLSFSQRALLFTDFQFHAFLPVSGIGLLIVSLFSFFSSYFIRSTKLQQDNGLIQKFSLLLFIEQCLNVIITCLYFQNRSTFNNVVQLLMMHLYYLSQFINAFYVGTFPPHLSKFCLILISSCQSLLIVITINLSSSNSLISEEQILIMWLIFMTFSVSISSILNDRKQIKLLFKQTNVFELQEFVQYIYYMMPELTNNNFKIQNQFIYCIFIQNHQKQCINCQKIKQSKNKVASKFVFTSVLYCIIKEHLGVLKMVSKSEYEQFEIYYADFLNKIKKQPLLSFVELKVYQLQNSKPSFYFKNTVSYFFEELKQIILDTRVQFHSNHHNFEENSLEIKDIMQAYSIEEYILPQIIELIDQKIRIWNEQVNGLDTIYDLEQLIVNYSSKILICQDLLEQKLQLDLMNYNQIQKARNVIELRIASIFHLIILNDFYSSLQCEQQISEVLAMENSLPNDVISNIDILQDNLCLIMVSMVKNRGYIKNNKKNYIANYFGLDVKEVESINHINLFIPQFIADIHEQFLQSYLETAQSPLFNQYQIVFSKFKNDFVQAQQLKLENNFDFYDDYVVTGCLSKVKETSEFVLFDENGKILSVTQGFYTDIIQQAFQEELTAQTINQAYIFLFFTNIFSILDQQKDNINLSEFLQVELMTTITIFENLSKIIQFFCENKLANTTSIIYSLRKSMQKTAVLSQTKTYTTKKQKENIQTGRYYVNNTVKISDEIQLLCPQFRTQVLELMQQFNKFSSVQYLSKVSLQYRTIGKKSAQRSYFIMEILDFRKKVTNATSSVNSKQFESIYNNKNFSSVLTDITTSERIVQKDEYRPNEIIGNSFNHLLSDREQLFGVLNQSFQESQSFGPLSQRANFISPRQHNLDDELKKLELEFQDIRVSFNGGAMVHQYAGDEKEDDDYNNESKSNKPQKSSSQKLQEKSYKMLKLLTTYKDKGIVKERDDHQSYSSKTSGTSKTQYISIIKNFQHSKIMITSLKIILALTLILFLCALSTIIINTQVIKSQISEIIDSSYSLNAPLFFNRYFFQSYALSWTLLMNGLKIVNHSDFLINQTFSTLKHQRNETFENLGIMYPKFIEIENMGLLNNISIQLLGFPRKTVSYTEFIDSIQNTLQYFFQIKYFSDEATDQVLDIDYINSVITLRYNLKYVFDMNKELIQSLDFMSQNIITDGAQELQSLTIAEICFIFFIHFVSLFFWKKTESQKQQILLINGRLQENSVNDLIYRHLNIKSILQSTDLKKNNWKKQQVCLIFQQALDNQEAKQYLDQRYSQLNKTKNDQNKKKGQVGMLNSRLRDTSYSIKKYICYNLAVFLIIASFLLGGYFYQSSLMSNLIPQQKLTLNFVRFSSYLDTLITTALVLKTQPQVYPGLIAHKFYTQAQFNKYRDPLKQLFHMFLDVYEVYDQNLTQIYEGILFSKDIDDAKKELLLGLYESDICKMITEKIPFCQYEQLGELNFIQKYSSYFYQDNNRDYLENGLVGITSAISYFMKTNFDYEIATIEYVTDMNELSDLYKTKEFINIILEHFSSTKETTQQMLEIILSSNEIILDEYLKLITIYYGLIGSGLLVLFAFFYYRLLDLTDDNFIHLRLGLTLVPIEVITDQYNIQLIKQLN